MCLKKVFSLFSATFKLKNILHEEMRQFYILYTSFFFIILLARNINKNNFHFLNTMEDKTTIMVMFQLSLLSEYILRTFNNLYVIYFIRVTTDAAATAPIYANH